MILPDVNVLVYAYRGDAPSHADHYRWLQATVNGPEAYGISPQVLSGVIRVCTHPRVFARPDRIEDILAFCDLLIAQPNCQLIEPGPRHWTLFAGLCRDSAATGNLVPDAWFAALAIEAGCEWITTDRDYARFAGLRWRTPF